MHDVGTVCYITFQNKKQFASSLSPFSHLQPMTSSVFTELQPRLAGFRKNRTRDAVRLPLCDLSIVTLKYAEIKTRFQSSQL